MLSRRLQILVDEERYRRLAGRAQKDGRSVAALIRDAIDQAFPPSGPHKSKAVAMITSAEGMEVGDLDRLREELENLRFRYG